MMMRKLFGTLCVVPMLAIGPQALAAPVTLTGLDVSYSFDDAQLGRFGAASISGNDLVFSPTSFAASTGANFSATQTIHLTVTARAGYTLTGFNLYESGAYSVSGAGSQVWVTGNLGATDIEGNPSLPTQYLGQPLASSFTPNGWTAQAGVNLPASGWGGSDGVTGSVGLTISNQLFVSAPLGSASVHKDMVILTAVAAPVPEPGTYAMLLAGLGLVAYRVRLRREARV